MLVEPLRTSWCWWGWDKARYRGRGKRKFLQEIIFQLYEQGYDQDDHAWDCDDWDPDEDLPWSVSDTPSESDNR